MARRGGRGAHGWNQPNNNTRFSGGSYSDEHDDRDRKPSTKRRVSFKPAGGRGRDQRGPNKGRVELAFRTRLGDDEEMVDFASYRTKNYRGGDKMEKKRKGSPIPRGRMGGRKLGAGEFGWYQVTINNHKQYEKDEIIRSILSALSPEIFVPYFWQQDMNSIITFYLDNQMIAERLLHIGSIQMADNYRLYIKVRPGEPITNIDNALKERMKLAMGKRYNLATKALDLSKFYADPDLKDVYCGLSRAPIMLAVINIISENIPHLEALNLNENNIQTVEHFKCLQNKLPHIKILYLADNLIQNVASLQAFRGLPIVELVLKNNPLRQRLRQEALYIREVRKRFPKLLKLDGKELLPQIVFDVQDSTALPQPKASFLCDAAGADIVRQFLEQYFIIFDSENRQPLLDAYHEQAMLSISLPPKNQSGLLTNYWTYNRNILRPYDVDAKYRPLRYGRLPCVSLLSELPKTQHDPQSFSVDLSLFTPKLICFTVAGVFKELNTTSDDATPKTRFFQRQFVVVPAGGGFCIRNELIFISNPTAAQLQTAFKPAAPAPVVAPVIAAPPVPVPITVHPVPSTSHAPPVTNIPATPDEPTKMHMIQAMSTQSNMNLEWSRKCLEENNWDFNHAAYVFDKLHKENRIPAEAFLK